MASWSSGYVIGNWIRVSKFESWKFRKSFFFFFWILLLKSSKNYNGINSIPKNIKGRKKAKKKLLQWWFESNTYVLTYCINFSYTFSDFCNNTSRLFVKLKKMCAIIANITRITFVDFCLTHFPHVSDVTLAEEVISFILARSIVFAWIDLEKISCIMISIP